MEIGDIEVAFNMSPLIFVAVNGVFSESVVPEIFIKERPALCVPVFAAGSGGGMV